MDFYFSQLALPSPRVLMNRVQTVSFSHRGLSFAGAGLSCKVRLEEYHDGGTKQRYP